MTVIKRIHPGQAAGYAPLIGTLDHVEARLFAEADTMGMMPECFVVFDGDGPDPSGVVALLDRPDYLAVQCPLRKGTELGQEGAVSVRRLVAKALPRQDRRRLFLKTNGFCGDVRALAGELGFSEYNKGWEMRLDVPGGVRLPDRCVLDAGGYDPRDAQVWLELLDDAFLGLHSATGGNPTTFRDSADHWMTKMEEAQAAGLFHGFWLDGEAVGLCLFHDDTIEPLAVHPKFHGKGFGREILMRSVAGSAEAMGWKGVWLFVVEANKGARDFYLRLGFAVTGEYSEWVMR